MQYDDLLKIEDVIGYKFNNLGLLQQAFTRVTFAKEKGGEDNDVLEFYGDEALDYSISIFLLRKFGKVVGSEYVSEYNSGILTSIKSYLVDSEMLSKRIDELDLSKYLVMGNGDIKQKHNEIQSVKEDLFEAIIGAVSIDSDNDLDEIDNTIKTMLDPENRIDEYSVDGINYIDIIQRWSQAVNKELPKYEYSELDNMWNSKLFLNVQSESKDFNGTGKTKMLANRFACKEAYNFLMDKNLFKKELKSEMDGVDETNAMSKLNDVYTKGYIVDKDIVEEEPIKGTFKTTINVTDNENKSYTNTSIDTSKPKSKGSAALKVLKALAIAGAAIGVIAGVSNINKGGK